MPKKYHEIYKTREFGKKEKFTNAIQQIQDREIRQM